MQCFLINQLILSFGRKDINIVIKVVFIFINQLNNKNRTIKLYFLRLKRKHKNEIDEVKNFITVTYSCSSFKL